MTHIPYPYKQIQSSRYFFIDILKHFTELEPGVTIYFEGSTIDRTKLYTRILKNYYPLFSKEFNIIGAVDLNNKRIPVLFDAKSDVEYLAFLIKRIN